MCACVCVCVCVCVVMRDKTKIVCVECWRTSCVGQVDFKCVCVCVYVCVHV